MKAADTEVSKESRDARVKKAPVETSELESEFAMAQLSWHHEQRKISTGESGLRMRKKKGTTSYRLTSGSSEYSCEKTALYFYMVDARSLQYSQAKPSVTA